MKIEVVSRISPEFHAAVISALEQFPSYYQSLDTTIALGPRLESIFPDIRHEWRHLGMFHRGATNVIGLAEYRRIGSPEGKLTKNINIRAGIAHESGHVFDLRHFGDPEKREYFSLNPNAPFLDAWKSDLGRLVAEPKLTESLNPIFQRHMHGSFGTKETFAELWATYHGFSCMPLFNIPDIRPYWPKSSLVVERCISALV